MMIHLRGSVPTPFGKIDVMWRKKDNQYEINIVSPEKIKKVIASEKTETYEKHITYRLS